MPRLPVFVRAAVATAALLAAVGTAHAADLTVDVGGAAAGPGSVHAALYGEEPSRLKEPLDGRSAPADAAVRFVWRDLPPGAYALSVFHDADANGTLDSNVAGLPTERYGFSRDARGRFGPPTPSPTPSG